LGDVLAVLGAAGVALTRGTARSVGFVSIQPFFCERRVRLRGRRHLVIGKGVLLEEGSVLYAYGGGRLAISKGCVIGRGTVIELASGLRYSGKSFKIGPGSSLAEYCFVGAAGDVTIGANVMMGQFVSIHAEDHVFDDDSAPIREQGVQRAPIVIQDDCWLGAGSRVLAGVTIGRGSVVAAGAIVTRDVPAGSVVAGVPARVVRSR
jgi:acetyltransferase-like isoleucine patch superfamily enzyme